MKEIHDIIDKIRKVQQRTVLATVVHIKGSTYRRPGARMLVTASQELVGAISGGCLEEDVRKKSQQVLEKNHVQLVTYDMMSDDDIVWGLGLGCNGIVQVLLEPLEASSVPHELQFVEDCYLREQTGFIAVIFECERQELIGRKYIYGEDNDMWQKIKQAKPAIFEQNKNSVVQIEIEGTQCKVLVESIMPTTVVVFGAGFDAVPVVEFCKNLGWKVIVCDHRETYLNAERFPQADERIVAHPKTIHQHLKLQPHHFVVVMTHNYHNDLQVLRHLSQTKVSYIGMLGPKVRTQRILDEIQQQTQKQIDTSNIFGPIGLDIGSETPEEIATAIIAEILAVKNKRGGGYLRQYEGSIH